MTTKTKMKNVLDRVHALQDSAVSCPICQQEFWGYSEIIFCSCGWTFIRDEERNQSVTAKAPAAVAEVRAPNASAQRPAASLRLMPKQEQRPAKSRH